MYTFSEFKYFKYCKYCHHWQDLALRITLMKCGFRIIWFAPWSRLIIPLCLKTCSSHALLPKTHTCILSMTVLRWKWTCPFSTLSMMIHRPSKSNIDSEMVQSTVRSELIFVCSFRYAGITVVIDGNCCNWKLSMAIGPSHKLWAIKSTSVYWVTVLFKLKYTLSKAKMNVGRDRLWSVIIWGFDIYCNEGPCQSLSPIANPHLYRKC